MRPLSGDMLCIASFDVLHIFSDAFECFRHYCVPCIISFSRIFIFVRYFLVETPHKYGIIAFFSWKWDVFPFIFTSLAPIPTKTHENSNHIDPNACNALRRMWPEYISAKRSILLNGRSIKNAWKAKSNQFCYVIKMTFSPLSRLSSISTQNKNIAGLPYTIYSTHVEICMGSCLMP